MAACGTVIGARATAAFLAVWPTSEPLAIVTATKKVQNLTRIVITSREIEVMLSIRTQPRRPGLATSTPASRRFDIY
jgi:hypothetical protein